MTPTEEITALKLRIVQLEQALNDIKERNPSYEDNSGGFANWEIANEALTSPTPIQSVTK